MDWSVTTLKALRGECTSKLLKESDLVEGAKRLGVPVIVIKAIAEVETLGEGYLPNGKLKILFERHRMYLFESEIRQNQSQCTHGQTSKLL